jgi:hypothetical protein
MGIKRRFEVKTEEIPDRPAKPATRTIMESEVIQRAKGVMVDRRVTYREKD